MTAAVSLVGIFVWGLILGGFAGSVVGYRQCKKDMRPIIDEWSAECRKLWAENLERDKRSIERARRQA